MTVYYFLSVARSDVGYTTACTQDVDSLDCLYLTAVEQMLAFTLQVMKSPRPIGNVYISR